MHRQGEAVRISIYRGESDQAAHTHKPLFMEVFLPQLDELITEWLVVIDPVQVVRCVRRDPQPENG